MVKPELIRPKWRSGGAFAEAVPTAGAFAEIKKALLVNTYEKLPRRSDDPVAQELEEYLPSLLKDLRMHDLGDWVYWWLMLGLSLLFLVVELIVVVLAARTSEVIAFQNSIIVGLVVLLVFFGLYVAASGFLHMGTELPRCLKLVPPRWFHALPVVWMGVFTVGLNFYVVSETGYSYSPFLHALLASAVVVLSLPRENSIPVIVLTIAATSLGVIGASVNTPASDDVIRAWGGHDLASSIVRVTFVYSAISVFVLRSIANHKLLAKS